jgi:hypothetical protein
MSNRLLRDGFRALIDKQPDLRVIGSTGGNRDTLDRERNLKPHMEILTSLVPASAHRTAFLLPFLRRIKYSFILLADSFDGCMRYT